MVDTDISSIQISNIADFRDKDGSVVSVVITDLIDCIDADAIYYGVTGKIPTASLEHFENVINLAAFSDRDECMLYAKDIAIKRNIPIYDATII